ncbi:MAG TPA: RNA polymerase factor sigma-54 [Ktedonobacterales bacterium]
METRLEFGAVAQAQPVISFRQIAAVRLLQLSSQQLTAAIAHERDTNPALEVDERECCLRCGSALDRHDLRCPVCGQGPGSDERVASDAAGADYEPREGGSLMGFEDDNQDPMLRLAGSQGRAEGLLRALWISCDPDDAEVAEYIVGSLDSHGYLPQTILDDAARALNCPRSQVVRVVAALQRLEPPGIGARNAAECLLIQLRRFAAAGTPRPLAERLVREHLKALAFRRFREVAHAIGETPKIVEVEWEFIRTHLNPYPAHGFDPDFGELTQTASIIRPDVIMRRREGGFEAEVVEERRYDLRVSQEYKRARAQAAELGCDARAIAHIRQSLEQAQTFLAALRQRWETMRRVSNALIELQRDFLEHGPSGLKPLTRADVANTVGLHESTVSRATDGKFVLLPNGRTVPFDDFFDPSLPIKKALRELISQENPRHPCSDEHLAHVLNGQGIEVARRTIAKYREEIGILPSRLRRERGAIRPAAPISPAACVPVPVRRAPVAERIPVAALARA